MILAETTGRPRKKGPAAEGEVTALIVEVMKAHNPIAVLGSGALVGTLGGLIGLGGAEFRLPLLIGVFGFGTLPAVMLNKAMSLVVVTSSLPSRASSVPFSSMLQSWDVIVTLLVGSLAGAWVGADWATKLASHTLSRVLAVILVAIAAVLLWQHEAITSTVQVSIGPLHIAMGILAGFGIGIVASLMGVAGGELLIPAIVLLFGTDLKLAGSLSLAVSMPTMLVGFTRYSRDQSFSIIHAEWRFLVVMALGFLVGTFFGGQLLGVVPTAAILPLLAAILVLSAVKVWRHPSR